MAKNMARIENGVVVNIEWCYDDESATETLQNTDGRIVEIGDTYQDGSFWRNGEKILSEVEELRIANAILMTGLEVET
jgi:hypothetical protein